MFFQVRARGSKNKKKSILLLSNITLTAHILLNAPLKLHLLCILNVKRFKIVLYWGPKSSKQKSVTYALLLKKGLIMSLQVESPASQKIYILIKQNIPILGIFANKRFVKYALLLKKGLIIYLQVKAQASQKNYFLIKQNSPILGTQ